MTGAGRSNQMRAKYLAHPIVQRPFFISENNWEIFHCHVYEDMPVADIAAARSTSLARIRQALADVDRQLSLPRRPGTEWTQLTASSPVEDLPVSVRARNRLRELNCASVEDVLRLDLNNSRIGRTTRVEILTALEQSGFHHAGPSEQDRSKDLRRLSEKLKQLRNRIDQHLSAWKHEVDRIEARLRRISERE